MRDGRGEPGGRLSGADTWWTVEGRVRVRAPGGYRPSKPVISQIQTKLMLGVYILKKR